MISIAAEFARKMAAIDQWVQILDTAFSLGSEDTVALDPTVPIASAAIDLHNRLRAFGSERLIVPYEGIFLSACADFELAVRGIIDKLVADIAARKVSYADLPEKMRTCHHEGCADIMRNIGWDKYGHLTIETVVSDLDTCLNPDGNTPYRIRVEAFSLTDNRNYTATVLKERLLPLGVKDLWRGLGKDPSLANCLTGSPAKIDEALSNRLDSIINARNNIVHRGRTGYAVGRQDVCQCCLYLTALVAAMTSLLTQHLTQV